MTRSIALLAGLALLLGACGKEGDLDRPGPLFSPKDKAEYSAQKRAQAEAASNAAAADEPGHPPTSGPGSDPYANPGPISQSPAPGERTPPSGSAQPQ